MIQDNTITQVNIIQDNTITGANTMMRANTITCVFFGHGGAIGFLLFCLTAFCFVVANNVDVSIRTNWSGTNKPIEEPVYLQQMLAKKNQA